MKRNLLFFSLSIFILFSLNSEMNGMMKGEDAKVNFDIAINTGNKQLLNSINLKSISQEDQNEALLKVAERPALKYVEIAKILIENKADPNTTDQLGATPLMRAAEKGSLAIVELLYEKTRNPNQLDKNQFNAADYAFFGKNVQVLNFLINKDFYPNTISPTKVNEFLDKFNYEKLFNQAVEDGNLNQVKTYIKEISKLENAQKIKDDALLKVARESDSKYVEIAKILVDNNANPDTINPVGNTPLMTAVSRGSLEIVQYLLKVTKNKDQINRLKHNAINLAYLNKNKEKLKLLWDAGLRPTGNITENQIKEFLDIEIIRQPVEYSSLIKNLINLQKNLIDLNSLLKIFA
ncbi:MAG: ankyrin repeat domain-containing protein [Candidatus Babeliales bacterium]